MGVSDMRIFTKYRPSDEIIVEHNEKTDVFTLIFNHNDSQTSKIYFGREAGETILESLKILLGKE